MEKLIGGLERLGDLSKTDTVFRFRSGSSRLAECLALAKKIKDCDLTPYRALSGFKRRALEVFVTEDFVNENIRRGTGFENGKLDVYSYFLMNESGKDKFLKGAYGEGGHGSMFNGVDYDESHGTSGWQVRLAYDGKESVYRLTWPQMAKRIDKMIDNVCSPGGSTIEGVKVLDEKRMEQAVTDAVAASYKRNIELGKA